MDSAVGCDEARDADDEDEKDASGEQQRWQRLGVATIAILIGDGSEMIA